MTCSGTLVTAAGGQTSTSTTAAGFIALLLTIGLPQPAAGQQSMTDVLSFLLTNRSVRTDDIVRDNQAAEAVRDTMSNFLRAELTTLPVMSSATAFSYRVDPELGGAVVRSSDSFGPFFIERSLTTGSEQPAFHIAYQTAVFDSMDGRSLSDGTLVATASRFRGELQPFDREVLSLRLRTQTVTLSTNVGLTDRLDVAAALPLVRLTLQGERVDILRGAQFQQAAARAAVSGAGDLVLRAKYNVLRRGGSGVAIGASARLPTGSARNLLGSGELSLKPTVIASLERERLAVHTEVGFSRGGMSSELDYGGAVTVAGTSRLTLVGEILGRRLASGGRLQEVVTPHPTLASVETIRLTSVAGATHRAMAVAGAKWNLATTWLLTLSVARPMTSAGLSARVIPSVVVEYSYGR